MRLLIALIAVPILATLWAVGLAVMAARRKDLFVRILCAGLALAAVVVAAGSWLMLGIAFWTGGESFARFAIEMPRLTQFGRVYFAVLGVLAVIVGIRQVRTRLSGR